MQRMIPIPFGRIGPDRANVRNTFGHHGSGGEDHAAGVNQAADHRLVRVVAAVPARAADLPRRTRILGGHQPDGTNRGGGRAQQLRGAAPAVPPGRTLRTGFNATQPAASAASAFDKRNWA